VKSAGHGLKHSKQKKIFTVEREAGNDRERVRELEEEEEREIHE